MTYTPPEGVNIGTFTADTLPASFNAPAGAVVSYKIYGTSAGAGVKTENLFDSTKRQINEGFWNNTGGYVSTPGWYGTLLIDVEPSTEYSFDPHSNAGSSAKHLFYNDNAEMIGYISSGRQTFTTPDNCVKMRFSYRTSSSNIMLVKGSTVPASYIPYGYQIPLTVTRGEQSQDIAIYIGSTNLGESEYVDYESGKIYKLQEGELTPTDPPVSLPTITATGETSIITTETLGDVELTGDWLAIMGSTEDESIDIEFTVDAEEYIAFVTVDDDPQIQVSDTITMPSSADSFTLEVVSWGRERYTETVYSALS